MFEFTKKPQSATLAIIVTGAIWFIVGTLYGLIAALHLVAPEFFNNIPWLVFGHTSPFMLIRLFTVLSVSLYSDAGFIICLHYLKPHFGHSH